MRGLSQELIGILIVGVAMIGTVLTTASDLRDDMRAIQEESRTEREAIRAEARANRAEAQARMEANRKAAQAWLEAVRAEARADREKSQARLEANRAEAQAQREADRKEAQAARERFEQELLRIAERYGLMNGLVEGLFRAVETGLGPPAPGPRPILWAWPAETARAGSPISTSAGRRAWSTFRVRP